MNIHKQSFGRTGSGESADLYTLTNTAGVEARITNYGGIIVSLRVPDRAGRLGDVVHGFDALDGYVAKSPYFGCIVGRFGNRIARGRFTLNGVEYRLATNDGPNALHGGLNGFDKAIWGATAAITDYGPGLVLRYRSVDGEEGYPGNLYAIVTYTLVEPAELRIDYSATCDKDTIINLTNHSYFNLAGEGDVLGHEVELFADQFTPVNESLIPTGAIQDVAGTPLDFRQPVAIGARITDAHEQIDRGGGYDHNFVVRGMSGRLRPAARVHELSTGRILEVHTTEPGVQFYTGNFLDGTITGKGGRRYGHRSGFCLETQHFPDSPNQPNFPSAVLKAGEWYRSSTVFRFTSH
jgi:aldose 1-epimerase